MPTSTLIVDRWDEERRCWRHYLLRFSPETNTYALDHEVDATGDTLNAD
jgi:hypothetical protein